MRCGPFQHPHPNITCNDCRIFKRLHWHHGRNGVDRTALIVHPTNSPVSILPIDPMHETYFRERLD
jgi:hypothetical protein